MVDDFHLLKKLDCDIRYVLVTTTDNDIYVYLLHSSSVITDSDKTEIEKGYLPLLDNIDSTQTKTFTINDNFKAINKMNDDIANYINARNGYNSFNIINTSRNHKFVIQSKVFAAAVKNCKKIYIDMGSVDTSEKANYGGSIRLDSTDYGEIDSLEINSGTLLLEDDVTLIVKKLDITYCTIDTFNKESNKSCSFSVLVKDKMDVVNMAIYSTIFTTFSNYNKESDNYLNTKFTAAFIRIFGKEKINENAKFERILIQGFSKCFINKIEVDDPVRYGGILKLDRMDKLTISGIKRNISEVDPTAPMIKIGRVAVTNLHEINIVIKSSASISSKYALIEFLEDTTGTTRSINLYNSNIINNHSRNLTIFRMKNVEINKVYLSDTKINENVTLFERTNAKLEKLCFNDCVVKGSSFDLTDTTKINLSDCDFTISGDLNLSSAYVTISGGYYRFLNMNVGSYETYPISKIDINKAEFSGGNLNFTNDASEVDMPFFDNECKYNVTKILLDKFNPTFSNSVICTNELTINNKKSSKFLSVLVNYREENTDTIFNVNSSASGNIMFTDNSSTNSFTLNLNDEAQFLSINPLDLVAVENSPNVKIVTNVPIKTKVYNFDNRYIHALFKEYTSTQSSTIDLYSNEDEPVTKVLNDSEKQMSITSSKEYEGNVIDYLRYTLTPI